MSFVETEQMSAGETGQMSVVETRQMSSVARAEQTSLLCQHTMLKPQILCTNVEVSEVSLVPILQCSSFR